MTSHRSRSFLFVCLAGVTLLAAPAVVRAALPSGTQTISPSGGFGASGNNLVDGGGNFTVSATGSGSGAGSTSGLAHSGALPLQCDNGTGGAYFDGQSGAKYYQDNGTYTVTVSANSAALASFQVTAIQLGGYAGGDSFTGLTIVGTDTNNSPVTMLSSTTISGSSIQSPSLSNTTTQLKSFTITFTLGASTPNTDFTFYNFTVSNALAPLDSDGTVTAGAGVTEPVALSTTVTTSGAAASLFDFKITDGGAADGQPLTVSQIVVNTSGTGAFGKVTWLLNGPDATNVTGSYSSGANTITFSGLTISVANGGNETYTVKGFYSDNTGHTENQTFILSVNGSSSFTVGGAGTQMAGSQSAVNNGTGTKVDVLATKLLFTTQPSGSTSGSALSGQPIVKATDAAGNTDVDFTGNVTLALNSGAGALSGTVVKAGVAGVATYTNVVYTATADQEAFTLVTSNAGGLTNATSNSVTSNVVATALEFSTQPAPTTIQSTIATAFGTVPVVRAVDGQGTIDTGYNTAVVLAVSNTSGGAAAGTTNSLTGTGDTDGAGTTVTLTPAGGVATFTGLSLTYTNGGATDSIALHATSGGLTAATSSTITSTSNNPPTIGGTSSGQTVNDNATTSPFSAVTIADADADNVSVAVTLDTAAKGVFTSASLTASGFTAAGGGVYNLASTTPGAAQTAIRALVYDPTDNRVASGSTETTTFTIAVNDGTATTTNSATTVVVTSLNDAPTLSGGPATLTTTDENTTSSGTTVTTILGGVTYADVDASALSGIAVTAKTGNGTWQYSTDGSTWAGFGTVTATSALLLNGTTQVRYIPDGLNGETATFTFRAWDQTSGTASTNGAPSTADPSANGGTTAYSTGTATASLVVSSVDDAPVATAGSTTASYTEGGSAPVIDATITLSDVDNANMAGAVVSITTGFVAGDTLNFTNQNGISGSYVGGTGVLTLTGSATTANYVTALRSITFSSTSDDPTALLGGGPTTNRTITWKVSDGTLDSNQPTSTLTVTAVNDAPVVTAGTAPSYTEAGAAATLAATLTVTDADNANLGGATVWISAGFLTGDTLNFTDQNGITGGYVGGTGILTLSGSASKANYQAALRSITFSSSSSNPTNFGASPSRTISWTATDGAATSGLATSTVAISVVNDAPVLTASGGATAFVEGNNVTSTVVAIDAGLTASDADSATFASATVSITANFQSGQDVLAFTNTSASTFGNIAGSYTSGTGILTLTSSGATATVAQWQAVLRAVTYTNSSDSPNPADRTISFVVNDGTTNSAGVTKTVSVTAVDDTPTDITLSAAAVSQSGGTDATVGAFTTSDLDDSAFTYTLVSGTGSTDNASFNLSGSTLRANNAAVLAVGTYSIRVRTTDAGTQFFEKTFTITVTDNVVPTVVSVAGPAAGTYGVGMNLDFTVTFSEPVVVTGSPILNVAVGVSARTATYLSGSGTAVLTFRYIVAPGDYAASGEVVIGALALNGGTIKDPSSNAATLTFTAPSLPGVLVEARFHSADTNQDWAIDLAELTRVIELYNTRVGSTRTGDYHTATATTEDGYTAGVGTITGGYHSADANHDGQIDLAELTRVIELYNTRVGTARTGQYHRQAAPATEDGFAPGP